MTDPKTIAGTMAPGTFRQTGPSLISRYLLDLNQAVRLSRSTVYERLRKRSYRKMRKNLEEWATWEKQPTAKTMPDDLYWEVDHNHYLAGVRDTLRLLRFDN